RMARAVAAGNRPRPRTGKRHAAGPTEAWGGRSGTGTVLLSGCRHWYGAKTRRAGRPIFPNSLNLRQARRLEQALLRTLRFTAGGGDMEALKVSTDVLFVLLGAVMVLAMHAGFAFLELGTVRAKNQVNALVKILCDLAMSSVAYFFIGYAVAYGVDFFAGAEQLAQRSGYDLVKFFFLLTFAAAVPAIISGGIA